MVELAVVPTGAVRLGQVQDRHSLGLGERVDSRRNRLPIFSITAGDAMGWPRCRQNWLTWPPTCMLGT